MAKNAMSRKNKKQEGGKKKTRKAGGKRKLSPALKAWNEKVMKVYRELKAKDKSVKLRDAMIEAKKRS